MFVCGICKHKKQRREGVFFHTCSDWWYARLFICNECLENVPVQQSQHELCYECGKHLSLGELTDLSKTRLAFLRAAIKDFENSHADILEQIPASTDQECMHPGSMHPNIKKWREKFMP